MDTKDTHDAVGLAEISTEDLRQLAESIVEGQLTLPLTPTSLAFQGFSHLSAAMAPFFGLGQGPLLGILRAVLAERRKFIGKNIDLVWSGSDAGFSYARYTKIVVPEVVEAAKLRVTIAGYSFDEGAGIFDALHRAMNERGVSVRFFLDVDQLAERLKATLRKTKRFSRMEPLRQAKHTNPEAYAQEVLSLFRELYWPYEGKSPDLFYDPRTADHRIFASLHAKCIIADDETVLITSANFTTRGQERNIEVGALIHDRHYAGALEHQWNNLVSQVMWCRGERVRPEPARNCVEAWCAGEVVMCSEASKVGSPTA